MPKAGASQFAGQRCHQPARQPPANPTRADRSSSPQARFCGLVERSWHLESARQSVYRGLRSDPEKPAVRSRYTPASCCPGYRSAPANESLARTLLVIGVGKPSGGHHRSPTSPAMKPLAKTHTPKFARADQVQARLVCRHRAPDTRVRGRITVISVARRPETPLAPRRRSQRPSGDARRLSRCPGRAAAEQAPA